MPTDSPRPEGSWIQPLSTGILAALVGFASTFAILLEAFRAVGATPAEAASGLLAISVVQGLLTLVFSLRWRMPISIVWSTPGAALMIATGLPAGGYPAAVGAIVAAAVLIIVAGLWKPFGRAAGAIPKSLAGAMLAGILFELCLAPVKAMAAMPLTVAPIVIAWALGWRFARLYAVPIALVVTAVIVVFVTKLPPDALGHAAPALLFTPPALNWSTLGSLGVPLFIVTMASQNVPGLAVLRANRYDPDIGKIFVGTGLGSIVTGLFGGHLTNLAAITAALCAGPDAHADPAKRYWATVVTGLVYIVLGLGAGVAAVLVTASPPLLIEAVAGLALIGSFGGAMAGALADERARVPAVVTFMTAASGVAFFGIGSAFWGLLAGGLLMGLDPLRR
ncbi:MAG TPA: benzoate/H(+) symporter BenE family transporter [Lichenihabitans sp.]|nr:benzoate/H(+) symporter BenE family transporter [Lichenihabitans sp.]